MIKNSIRVRFAPAPTGMMHLGNIRTALMNFLFARKHQGTFVLRIEDTDQERNFDPLAEHIQEDLRWLGLMHDEGPGVGGAYGPYFQSQRNAIYEEKRQELEAKQAIYRCFCTAEELDIKRKRQEALHIAPRYDRTCLHLSPIELEQRLAAHTPFIWRVKLDHTQTVTVHDLAHGTTVFELKNFSDFPLTRQDGTFTFLFANFVDDLTMRMTHVFRGEDHKSNTANQAALYKLFDAQAPLFWHLPIICNIDGKKLSKRDFGFSLRDLKNAGFLPEALCNYLGIIGGSYAQEIMSLSQMAETINLDQPSVTGQIKYDLEKLKWLNHKWISLLSPTELAVRCRPFLAEHYSAVKSMGSELDNTQLGALLAPLQTDLITLADSVTALRFYFEKPVFSKGDLEACVSTDNRAALAALISQKLSTLDSVSQNGTLSEQAKLFVDQVKQEVQAQKLNLKEFFWFLRLALTGNTHGPAIHILIEMLGTQEAKARIEKALSFL